MSRPREGVSELLQKLAVAGKLQYLSVMLSVSGDPDISFLVDVDTMLGFWPIETVAWPSPRFEKISSCIKH
jgi:hypothetical protein